MKKITIEKLECNRCNHEWWPRINNQDKTVIPDVCPKCKSRYWNKERIFGITMGPDGKTHGKVKIVKSKREKE